MSRMQDLKSWLKCNFKNIMLLFFTLGLLVIILSTQVSLIFMNSNSVPYSVCLQVYHCKPQKGDLCAFDLKGLKLVKYIAGVAGDRIRNIKNVIYVGVQRIGEAKETSILTPVRDRIIPQGYVFVAGSHKDSFDSRYEEFGLVRTCDIKGKVFGLLKFEQ